MQEGAAACNTEKLAALSAIAKLDRQIYEAQGSMADILATCDTCCGNELRALEAQHGLLKVCTSLASTRVLTFHCSATGKFYCCSVRNEIQSLPTSCAQLQSQRERP